MKILLVLCFLSLSLRVVASPEVCTTTNLELKKILAQEICGALIITKKHDSSERYRIATGFGFGPTASTELSKAHLIESFCQTPGGSNILITVTCNKESEYEAKKNALREE